MKTRYYYDEDLYNLYIVEEDGQTSAIDVEVFWRWVHENDYNTITFTEDSLDHRGEHVQREYDYTYDNYHEFLTEIADKELIDRYIAEEKPQTISLLEIL